MTTAQLVTRAILAGLIVGSVLPIAPFVLNR